VDSEDDEEDRKIAANITPNHRQKKYRGGMVTQRFERDGLEIVDPPVNPRFATISRKATDRDDDEIQIVGGKNIVNLPHSRQHCIHCRFDPSPIDGDKLFFFSQRKAIIDKNKETCPACYCYVCDKPAAECQNWFSSSYVLNLEINHCCAVDTCERWKKYRRNVLSRNRRTTNAISNNQANDETRNMNRSHHRSRDQRHGEQNEAYDRRMRMIEDAKAISQAGMEMMRSEIDWMTGAIMIMAGSARMSAVNIEMATELVKSSTELMKSSYYDDDDTSTDSRLDSDDY